MSEAFETTTNVRFRRSKLWGLLAILPMVLVAIVVGKFLGVWFFLLPAPFVFLFANRVVRTRVVASAEGLRVGERLVPRGAFTSALVRHEGDTTFVALQGRENVDVEARDDAEADALLRALRLDATSAAAEFALVNRGLPPWVQLVAVPIALAVGVALMQLVRPPLSLALFGAFMAALITAARISRRVTLRVGADGIVVRDVLGRERFVSHDAIRDVRADGTRIVIERTSGASLVLDMPPKTRERAPSPHDDEADAIVRRIRQARTAFREGNAAPELSVLLDRGSRMTREWLADLRRIGEGAASTFRTIGVAREQLFDVLESTTAAAKDRIAAMIALRAAMSEDDKPRIRIATDRVASPELRERMVRILDAADESELEDALKEDLESRESSKDRT